MTSLWIVIALMLMTAVLILLWPLLPFKRRTDPAAHVGQKQDNIAIFRDRLQELDNDIAQGNIDQSLYDRLKAELEKNLLEDVAGESTFPVSKVPAAARQWPAPVFIVLAMITGSLWLYTLLGRSDDYAKFLSMQQGTDTAVPEAMSIQQAITQLETKLQQDPTDVAKWYLLAKSYSAIGQYDKSAQVFAKLGTMLGTDDPFYPAIKAAYAQANYMAAGETMTPEVRQAVDEALQADPLEPNALLLLGLDAYSQDNFQKAINIWQKARQKAGDDLRSQFLDPAIVSAQEKLGQPGETALKTAETGKKPTASKSPAITIRLDIARELKAKVNPEQLVFVFAQEAGQRMPLAAERIRVGDLPAEITLDDSKAVMPTARLSSVSKVDITARISFSGQAMAQSGDLFTTRENIAVNETGSTVDLDIDQVVQ